MTFWEDLFAASIFVAVPTWLVSKAWRRYREVNWPTTKQATLGRSALGLLTLSLAVMVLGGVVAVVEENLGVIRAVEKIAPTPWKVAAINSSICLGSLLFASQMQRGGTDVVKARRSIVTAGIYLTIAWLLIVTTPH